MLHGTVCALLLGIGHLAHRGLGGRIYDVIGLKNNIMNRFTWLAVAALLFLAGNAGARTEEVFDVLQVGTRSFTNATVTTKGKTYIIVSHSEGMSNIKI